MPYFTFFLSLIAPIYASGFALFENTKKNTGLLPIFSFALVFASIGFCVEPSPDYDLYRHYERIDSIQGMSYSDVLSNSLDGYILFNSYAWLLNTLSIPKQFFTATVVFVSYVLVLSVYSDVKKNRLIHSTSTLRLFSFLIFWLSIDFVFISSGLRNLFANSIIFYVGYHLITYKKKHKFLIGAIIAFYIHPASMMPAVMVYFSSSLNIISRYSKSFGITGVLLLFGNKIVSIIIEYIDSFLSNIPGYSSIYLDSDSVWGAAYIQSSSQAEVILNYMIYRLPSYIGMAYIAFHKPKQKDSLYLLLSISVLLLGLFYNFYTFYQRLSAFFLYLFALFIVIEYTRDSSRNNLNFLLAYLISLIIYSIASIYVNRYYLSSAVEVFYKPLLFLIYGL